MVRIRNFYGLANLLASKVREYFVVYFGKQHDESCSLFKEAKKLCHCGQCPCLELWPQMKWLKSKHTHTHTAILEGGNIYACCWPLNKKAAPSRILWPGNGFVLMAAANAANVNLRKYFEQQPDTFMRVCVCVYVCVVLWLATFVQYYMRSLRFTLQAFLGSGPAVGPFSLWLLPEAN